jgi:cation diffusion facilitator family transporter
MAEQTRTSPVSPTSAPAPEQEHQATAMHVSAVSIAVNLVLSLGKLAAGVAGHSGAMISDAVHSASDVFSTFVVILGVRLAGKQPDEDHPYGHERMECVAALLLAIMLGAVGVGIGWSGLQKILGGNYAALTVPGALPLAAAVISIAVKEWMFRYTRAAARRVNSGALMADAWHHRSDALSSVGSFVGILFARLGFPVMDALASVVISVCIVKAACDIFKDGLDKMVDHSCDAATEAAIRAAAAAVAGVQRVDVLRTRLFGDKIYVDMEIAVDGEMKLVEAHTIAEAVHHAIEAAFPVCKHCMVHVNPARPEASGPAGQGPAAP